MQDSYFNTYEETVYSLCKQVDMWKKEAEYWKKEYEEMEKKHSKLVDDSIKHGNAMMGNMLKLCLETDEGQLNKAFGKNE